jgi:chromosome segregation ATPase
VRVANDAAEILVQEAHEQVEAAMSERSNAIAALADKQANLHALQAQFELLTLDFKEEYENHQQLKEAFRALKNEYALLDAQSQAHLTSVKTLHDRELQRYDERLNDIVQIHDKEISRLIEQHEVERHSQLVALDGANQETIKTKESLKKLYSLLSNAEKDKDKAVALQAHAQDERDHLKQLLVTLNAHSANQLALFENVENQIPLAQEAIINLSNEFKTMGKDVFQLIQSIEELKKDRATVSVLDTTDA